MEREREPERVEIELTPTDAPSRRREPSSVHVPALAPTQLLATERSRLITTALGVGVVALVLGWLAGRAGGENGATSDAAASTTAVSTSSVPATSVPGFATIPPVETTVERTPRTTTTTTSPPPVAVSSVAVDDRLVGSGVRLVGGDTSTGIFELDLDSGELTRTRIDSRNFDPTSVSAGGEWTSYQTYESRTQLVILGRDGEETTVNADYGVLHLPGTDLFWRPVEISDRGRAERWEEFDVSGAPTGRVLDVTAGWPIAVDPAGGLVLQETLKAYRLDLDGQISLLADGELFGLDERAVVYRGCDDQLNCSLWKLDRATGERAPIDLIDVEDDQISSMMNWGLPAATSTLTPGGDAVAVVRLSDAGFGIGLVDLTTGSLTELVQSSIDQPSGLSWSSDGRWAFYLVRGAPMCFDRETGETYPVADGLNSWGSVTVRTASP